MTDYHDKGTAAGPEAVFGEAKKYWGWLLALGILFIVLGAIGLSMVFGLTMASVLFFGILMLIGGVAQLVEAFKCKGWKSILWHVIMAILYVFGGIVVISNPLLASMVLTIMLAAAFIGIGLTRFLIGLQMRGSKGWVWPMISGIVSILLGVVIIAQWPISGLWVIGLFVAVELIVHGLSYTIVALAAKSSGQAR